MYAKRAGVVGRLQKQVGARVVDCRAYFGCGPGWWLDVMVWRGLRLLEAKYTLFGCVGGIS